MSLLVLAAPTNTLKLDNYTDWYCQCAYMCAVMLCLHATNAALAKPLQDLLNRNIIGGD